MSTSYALRPAWTPLTILLMVVGFVVFWPLGLAMLAYIIWGDRVPEVKRHFAATGENVKREWNGLRGGDWNASRSGFSASGNAAFDDYRDKEEFDRFMRERTDRKGGETIEL